MRKAVFAVCSLLILTTSLFAGTCGNGYTYAKKFTVPIYQVPNTDQTNFPVYLAFNGVGFGDILLSDLKTVANGGKIQNTANNSISVSGPADLVFCDAASTGNALKYEVSRYSAATGAMEAHVLLSILSHTTATTFWMFYGNASVSTTQQDLSLWSTANYIQVCHLPDGASLNVSCSIGGTQVNHGASATSGALDGGGSFLAASSQYIDVGAPFGISGGSVTMEAWIKPNSFVSGSTVVESIDASSNGYSLRVDPTGSGKTVTIICNAGSCFQRLANSTIPTAGWSLAAGSYTAPNLNLYTNGVNDNGSTVGSSVGLGNNSTVNMAIGSKSATHTIFYNGLIDEVRVSNVARSADWIKSTYNNQASPSAFAWMSDVTVGTGARVIQYATCRGASPVSCTFPGNVTSGNLLVAVISANSAGTACTIPASNYSDTLSSTFSILRGDNSGGLNQAATCLGFATLSSSGSETVTLTYGSVAYGEIFEIAGVAAPSLDVAVGAVSTSSSSLFTGSATATTANSIIICGTAQTGTASTGGGFSSSVSPSTSFALNNMNSGSTDGASALIQFTGAGSKSCTFTYNSAGSEQAATLAIIKYSPANISKKAWRSQTY
jgi:hypothetical protein